MPWDQSPCSLCLHGQTRLAIRLSAGESKTLAEIRGKRGMLRKSFYIKGLASSQHLDKVAECLGMMSLRSPSIWATLKPSVAGPRFPHSDLGPGRGYGPVN